MKSLANFTSCLLRWIDDAAAAALSIGGVLRRPKKFQLEEQADDNLFAVRRNHRRSKALAPTATLSFDEGQFAENTGTRVRSQLAGSEIELILAGRRFMFRSLELPKQASGFLDAIVRAQVDRLTPWTPAQVAFGCGAPTEMAGGRVGVTVAATARSSVIPLVSALELLAPDSIVVSTAPETGTEKTRDRIVVFSQQTNRERRLLRMRQILVAAPVLAGLAALAAMAAWFYVGADLEAARLQVSRQIAERRVALLSGRGSVAEEAAAMLAQRKRATAASVIVLESLSQALPDDTYVTQLQLANGDVQISGITREAASLIRIIEQTDQFKHATFFAPTTRAPVGDGEQFHIEARVTPYFPAVQ
jgi:general secretion pathway protein L